MPFTQTFFDAVIVTVVGGLVVAAITYEYIVPQPVPQEMKQVVKDSETPKRQGTTTSTSQSLPSEKNPSSNPGNASQTALNDARRRDAMIAAVRSRHECPASAHPGCTGPEGRHRGQVSLHG